MDARTYHRLIKSFTRSLMHRMLDEFTFAKMAIKLELRGVLEVYMALRSTAFFGPCQID